MRNLATLSNVLNVNLAEGTITVADADFVNAARRELDACDEEAREMYRLWPALTSAEQGAKIGEIIAKEGALLEGFKERFGAELGRRLWSAVDY